MSSTNKTAKLGLSQFLGTDKPAWLGDYNSDMQKIDDAFADLEQGDQSLATDIAALQQKDVELEQSITDVNDRVDTVSADLITVGNRTTVLEGNYDTMHHEVAVLEQAIDGKVDKTRNPTFENTDNIYMRSSDIVKGVTPTTQKYMQLRFQDSSGQNDNAANLGRIVYTGKVDGTSCMQMINMKNDNSIDQAIITVGFNADGAYATCPTPVNPNAKNMEIATTEWVWNLLTSLGLVTTP